MGSGYSCEAYEERKKNVHVVIVGGGYGGIHCAAHLQNSGIKFTLIDEKDYFHHNVGALRAVVFPGNGTISFLKMKHLFCHMQFSGQTTSRKLA